MRIGTIGCYLDLAEPLRADLLRLAEEDEGPESAVWRSMAQELRALREVRRSHLSLTSELALWYLLRALDLPAPCGRWSRWDELGTRPDAGPYVWRRVRRALGLAEARAETAKRREA